MGQILQRAGLAALIVATSVAAGLWVAWWVVPPYLALVGWLLFAPEGRAEPADADLGPAEEGPSSEEIPAIDAPESAEASETPPAKPKKGRGRGRAKAPPALPTPVEVSWVKVGPGKFVRVETPAGADAEVPADTIAGPGESAGTEPAGPGDGDGDTGDLDPVTTAVEGPTPPGFDPGEPWPAEGPPVFPEEPVPPAWEEEEPVLSEEPAAFAPGPEADVVWDDDIGESYETGWQQDTDDGDEDPTDDDPGPDDPGGLDEDWRAQDATVFAGEDESRVAGNAPDAPESASPGVVSARAPIPPPPPIVPRGLPVDPRGRSRSRRDRQTLRCRRLAVRGLPPSRRSRRGGRSRPIGRLRMTRQRAPP